MITQRRLKEIFDYNPNTGIFTYKQATSRSVHVGDIAGSMDEKGYLRIKIYGHSYRCHRLAWLFVHGSWPNDQIDHINSIRNDNRLINLREVSNKINCENRIKPMSNNKIGFLGVYVHHGKYATSLKVDGIVKRLGHFNTPEEAHQVYLEAKRKYHKGCTI